MDWLKLEGIPRVYASYKVWRQTRRTFKQAKKNKLPKHSLKFLKEDTQYELDELIDAIIWLNKQEHDEILNVVTSRRLRQLILTYKCSSLI